VERDERERDWITDPPSVIELKKMKKTLLEKVLKTGKIIYNRSKGGSLQESLALLLLRRRGSC
jgi:predicted RNA methylase